jgi:hypothetical protein
MHRILDDFIRSGRSASGVGLFRGDEPAIRLARKIGKNQVHKFNRYGKFPRAFYAYLDQAKIRKPERDMLEEEDVLEILWHLISDPKNKISDMDLLWADSTRKRMLLDLYPGLKKSFGDQASVWTKLENGRRPAKNRDGAGLSFSDKEGREIGTGKSKKM